MGHPPDEDCYSPSMKIVGAAATILLLLSLAGCRTVSNGPTDGQHAEKALNHPHAASSHAASASGFDFYLLNLSWSPEFCYSHPQAAECAQHAGFVLHGLWPQNADGTYPEHCSNAPGPADPSNYRDLYPDQGLLKHEWQTHGTCTGMSADAFFAFARRAVHSVAVPDELNALSTQTSLSPDEIIGLFAHSNPSFPRSSLLLSCGHNYLTAIEICMDKSLHPIPCPSGLRSCRASVVRIPPR
ncbi:MAG: ribonuclease T2 [Terracidiphilus sp.]